MSGYGYISDLMTQTTNAPIGLAGPRDAVTLLSFANNFKLPPTATYVQKYGPKAVAQAITNSVYDLGAPGVRDQIARPAPFATTEHRGSLFDTGRVENNAPVWNSDQMMSTFTSPHAQRLGSFWWEVTHDVENRRTPGFFIDQGQYSVPPTGQTALRNLRPGSTMYPI